MYKVLEVTGIIGAIYIEGKQNISISIDESKISLSFVTLSVTIKLLIFIIVEKQIFIELLPKMVHI